MHNDSIEDVQYWSDRIEETSAKLEELKTKYINDKFNLSYEDNYEVMYLVREIQSYSRLLSACLINMNNKKKPSLIKRIFKK